MVQFIPKLSKGETEALVRGWMDDCLWRQEAHRAETNGFEFLATKEIDRLGNEDSRGLDDLLRLCGTIRSDEEQKAVEQVLAGRAPLSRFASVIAAAGRSLKQNFDVETPDGRLFARTVLRGYKDLLRELQDRAAAIPRQIAATPERLQSIENKKTVASEPKKSGKRRSRYRRATSVAAALTVVGLYDDPKEFTYKEIALMIEGYVGKQQSEKALEKTIARHYRRKAARGDS